MTAAELTAATYAAALGAYKLGHYDKAWRTALLQRDHKPSAKLADMALRRMLGRGPAERFPYDDFVDDDS